MAIQVIEQATPFGKKAEKRKYGDWKGDFPSDSPCERPTMLSRTRECDTFFRVRPGSTT